MEKNYLYFSDSCGGCMNLARDEWFLDHVRPGELILHFYINDNAVIIGKNQNPLTECNLAKMKEDGVTLVRRISGGGAVYHDRGNLNFSFIAGKDRFDKDRQHLLIAEAVRSVGIPCSFSGRNDLLADGKKFSGNAYCARGEGRQHHGTLLISSDLTKLERYLTVDPRKIASKGVASVRSRVCNLNEFRPGLTVREMKAVIPEAFRRTYGDYESYPFRAEDRAEVRDVYLKKHVSRAWRYGSTPPFDYEIDERLPFGGVRILLRLKDGKIASSKTYTDANDDTLAERVDALLAGAPFEKGAIVRALLRGHTEETDALAGRVGAIDLPLN